jgi:UDP-N-acetylglucosamine diphosphorylase/glucosamine-1-phosphate N-acetyltransferase
MKAVFLAAGEGVRMRPLTYTRPKSMLPLANRPLLEYSLLRAKEAGINDFIFLIGYHGEQVYDYFGDGKNWDVKITYCIQRKQIGTADAIRIAAGQIDGDFMVVNGDNIVMSLDFKNFASSRGTTIGTIEVEDTGSFGSMQLAGDRVVKIMEKAASSTSKLVNAGIYLFTPSIFQFIERIAPSPRGEYEITDAIQLMIDEGQEVKSLRVTGWINVSHPWDLLPANEQLLKNIPVDVQGEVEPNVTLKGPVSIGKGTVVRSGAYIVGPVYIGENCDIGPNCFIRPFTAIGDGCHVGSAVEIKNSIIMRGTKIPHQNYVGDSVIGESCNFGAGTKIANLRLDNGNISVNGRDTGRRKLGAIIGDSVKTGINACIDIGSLIGNNAFIGPGTVVHSIISPNSRIS